MKYEIKLRQGLTKTVVLIFEENTNDELEISMETVVNRFNNKTLKQEDITTEPEFLGIGQPKDFKKLGRAL